MFDPLPLDPLYTLQRYCENKKLFGNDLGPLIIIMRRKYKMIILNHLFIFQ